ncbi:ribonuclease P protein subunit p40-like isoform X1 [Cataglyphis hispanica]|uniref:ribonuclease P protein subunit p40-like isoform X1 n=2 Tax=Cataglyphis hispanica TaxID=1086592 RepID=UPI00217F4C5F|nr:ribonuclease P protein subunit p40-like isoform X1 [Cataglyphis hispanica]XP_050446080.1 ribonuclease P protein subunit p40-like isoform X1 [Cataglyphis hispanica]
MLCPETYDFKPPRHYVSVDNRDFTKTDIPSVMDTHYFNHSISIVLPDTVTVPSTLWDCLSEDTDYYRINALCAYDLLNAEFIEAFIKKGEVSLLTIENKIDLQNSICVTPTGYLLLSLVTEDYQALGLEGKPSFFDRKPHTRYVVTINLKNENFVPGKKNYERTRIALKRLKQSFDVVVLWDPPRTDLCPSSIAAWFYACNYDVYLCHQTCFQRAKYSTTIPILQEGCDLDKFFEWLGFFSIGGDLFNREMDNYVNTYECPPLSIDIGQVQHLQWTGFFTRKKLHEIYNVLKEYVLSRKTLPWVSLDIQGFADSPISWDLKEHMFFTDGDNSYTIIFRPTGESIVRKSLSSNNKPRISQ